MIRIDDVLRLEAWVALLRVVRDSLLLVAGRTTHQPILARVLARRRPHPPAGDRRTVGRAVLARRAKRTKATARAYSARRAGGARECRSSGSRVGEVEAIAALSRVSACSRHLPSGVRPGGALHAISARSLVNSIVPVGIDGAWPARLGAHCCLVVARIARHACHTRCRDALLSLHVYTYGYGHMRVNMINPCHHVQ